MRSIYWFLPVLCITVAAQNAGPDRLPDTITYIVHVTVIDTETGKEDPGRTVIVAAGKISDVRDDSNTTAPVTAKVIDGRGKFLIPGLWDMHVHAWDYESTYSLFIANGVTGVREMFGPPDANNFRAELASKHAVAPHFYVASPIVDGHPPVWSKSIEVTTAAQARAVVDDQKQKGADFIKVYSRLSREAYFAISGESTRVGIPFEGHVPAQITAWEASDSKQKSFEHLNGIALACSTREQELQAKINATLIPKERYALMAEAARTYSPEKCDRLFTRLKANGNWQAPTLTVARSFSLLTDPQFRQDSRLHYFGGEYRDWLTATAKGDTRLKSWTTADFAIQRELFQFDEKMVGAMFRSGVPLLSGTDAGNPYCFPGFSLHDELALLVDSGLTPLAALQAATRNAAIFMNAADRYGSVAKGKIADLVLLDADPLQDIHNTTKIAEVFLDGKELNRTTLDGVLEAAETEASASDRSPSSLPQPATEMKSLAKALEGRWSITEKYEPDEWTPNGGRGYGEEVWRRGPGGFTFMEEIHDHTPGGEQFGIGFSWWDSTKGLQGLWCINTNPQGCDLQSAASGFGPKWDGKQLVVDTEFPRDGKKFVWHEVFSDIAENSFSQTADIGEKGGPLKRWLTIHATRVTNATIHETATNSDEAELRAFMADLRKASIEGDVETATDSMTDDYVQTDINGYRQDKTTWLNEYFKPLADLIKTGKFHWDEYERKNLQFRFYGDCAVVTGELHAKGTGAKFGPQHTWVADPNATFSGTLHFTHVYAKQNGKWMLAALHNQMSLPPANAAK